VAPGDYTFRVKAANADGVWNDEGASLRVRIKPPFWRTRWFQATALMGCLGLAVGGYRARVVNLQKKADQLAQQVEQALAEIKVLSGFLPICASCKRIRDDRGEYVMMEQFISEHSEAVFSHGICPECVKKIYPELTEEQQDGPTG
jgi:hypothetical protein